MDLQIIKTKRLYIQVAEQLSKLVENGTIKPGERFPAERDLAEQLGVSRPTIREAMIAMELAGIIEIRTGSGIYVTRSKPLLDTQALANKDRGIGPFEILEIRYMLEGEACALAASRITDAQIQELKQTLLEMEKEEKQDNASEQADWKFHSVIAEACQNSAIYIVINWLWELRNKSELSQAYMERLRKEGVHPSIQDHRKIIEALEKRDPEKARVAMKMHIENATAAAAAYFGKEK